MIPVTFTVLGASGYVGSHLVAYLRSCGHEVWAPAKGDIEVFTRPLGHVFYCIGLTADFRTRPFDTVEAHVSFLADVLQHAQFDSLLYLSSTRVYMGAASTCENTTLAVQPDDPSYLYNLSKLAGESLCHASGKSGVRVVRLSNVVGPEMDTTSGNFIATLLNEAYKGRIFLQSDLRSSKDYIYIEDVVVGLLLISLKGDSHTYNLASGKNTTHREWVDWIQKENNSNFIVDVDANAEQQFFPVIDISLLKNKINFLPGNVLNYNKISINR